MVLKAVCTDLDGTLFDASHRISEFTANVVRKLKAANVFFIVATGRAYFDVFITLRNCQLEPDYIITSNGGRIHDFAHNVLVECNMDEHIVCSLFQLTLQPNANGQIDETCQPKRFVTNVNCNERWFTERCLPEIREVFNKEFKYEQVNPFEFTPNDLRGTHCIWFRGEHEDLEHFQRYIQSHYGDKLWCGFSLPYILDCVALNVNKGKSLLDMCELLQIKPDEVAAFGDGMNDESMLHIAGKAFVMGNAPFELHKAVPDAEVIDTNSNDGVAKKLIELFDLK